MFSSVAVPLGTSNLISGERLCVRLGRRRLPGMPVRCDEYVTSNMTCALLHYCHNM
jgi:hypothetical protein